MGNLTSALTSAFKGLLDRFSDRPAKILMLGLDAAGKTTVLYKLKLNEVVNTIPTIGFNVESLSPVHEERLVHRVGHWRAGQDTPLWKHYFVGTHGLIFLVDSSDKHRSHGSDESNGQRLSEN